MREDSWLITSKGQDNDRRRPVDSWAIPASNKSNGTSYSRNLLNRNNGNGNGVNNLSSRSPRAPVDSWSVPLTRPLPPNNGSSSPPSPLSPSYDNRPTEQHANQPISSTRDYHNNDINDINADDTNKYTAPSRLNCNPSTNKSANPSQSDSMSRFTSNQHQQYHASDYQSSYELNGKSSHHSPTHSAFPNHSPYAEQVPQPQLHANNANTPQRRYLRDDTDHYHQHHYQHRNNDEMSESPITQYQPYGQASMNQHQHQHQHQQHHHHHHATEPKPYSHDVNDANENSTKNIGTYGQPYRNHGSLFSEADSPMNTALHNRLHNNHSNHSNNNAQAMPMGTTSNRWISYTAEDARNDAWRDQPASPVPPPPAVSSTMNNQYQSSHRALPPPINTTSHYHRSGQESPSPVSPLPVVVPRTNHTLDNSGHGGNTSPSMSTRHLHTMPSNSVQPYAQPMPTYLGSKADRKRKKDRSFCAQFCYILFCCCCFRRCCFSRRSCFCTCLIIFLILAACLGLAAYFLWPRMPEVKFVSASMSSVNPKNQAVGEQAQLPQWNNGTVSMNVAFLLNVKSDNYISLKVNNITVDGFLHPTNMGNASKSATTTTTTNSTQNATRIPVGQGSLPSEITFPGRASTNFKLFFLLSFNTNEQSQIPAFYELLDACGVTGNAKRKMRLEYDAKVDLAVVSSLGIRPSVSDKVDLDCPYEAGVLVQMSQVRTLIRAIGPQFGLSQSRINTILAGHDSTT